MAEPRRESEADRWLRQARFDLSDGEYAAAGGRHALACFLAHQAAEKAVSAFLFASGAERVWGHALADLCQDAMNFDASFDVLKSEAMLLDKHYLGARYPSALPGGVPAEAYDALDAERALQIAQATLEFVRSRVAGTIATP
ncbi:MAG: HEPN domain-containing protein [Dehalococcoidia bacterium]